MTGSQMSCPVGRGSNWAVTIWSAVHVNSAGMRGCELAQYLCRMDFVLADMMGMELVRTAAIAEGGERCDFGHRRTKHSV